MPVTKTHSHRRRGGKRKHRLMEESYSGWDGRQGAWYTHTFEDAGTTAASFYDPSSSPSPLSVSGTHWIDEEAEEGLTHDNISEEIIRLYGGGD